jgi:hypothetical protein
VADVVVPVPGSTWRKVVIRLAEQERRLRNLEALVTGDDEHDEREEEVTNV